MSFIGGESLGSAVLVLRTDQAPLNRGLAEAERKSAASADRMQATLDRKLTSAGHRMGQIGSTMTRSLTVPIIGLGVAAADAFSKFQSNMEMVHTQAGASQHEVDALTGKVLNLAKALPQGPQQLAQGLFHLESIGLRGAKAMDALKIAAQGAAVGNSSLEETATALGSAWLVNIKGAGNLQQVMGILNATVGAGNMRMGELVQALGTGLLPAAKVAGLSIKDVMGALAVFTDEGYQASSAAAQFSTALHFFTNPTSKADKALQGIGMSANQMAVDMRKPNGLLVALRDLHKHLDTLPGGAHGVKAEQTLGDILPGGRGRIMLTLLNQLDRYQMKLGQITKTAGHESQALAATQQTEAYKIHVAWSRLQVDAIEFGQKVLPGLLKVGQWVVKDVTAVTDAFTKLPKGAQDAILKGGLILAGIGPAMKLLGVFTGGVGRLWQVASIAARLAAGKGWSQATGRGGPGPLAASSVGTMEVGTLIARGMIGGVGGTITTIPGVTGRTGGTAGTVLQAGERQTAGGVILPAGTRSVPAAGEVIPGPIGEAGLAGKGALSRIGGIALRGLGAIGIAAFAAPLVVGLGKAIKDWSDHDALAAGRTFARNFTKDLPGRVSNATKEGLAHATTTSDSAHGLAALHQLHAVRGAGAAPSATAPSAADVKSVFQSDFNKGYKSGQSFIEGLQHVKFPSTPTLIKQMIDHLRKLDPQARQQGAKMMLGFAASLEQHGRLPRGAVDKMIISLHGAFPGLLTFLGRMGLSSDKEFAKYLKFQQSTKTLISTLADYRTKFGGFGQDVKLTGQNVNKYAKVAMDDLKWQMQHGSADARKAATKEFEKLRAAVNDNLQKMGAQVATSVGQMKHSIQTGTGQARQAAATNFQHYQDSVLTAMKNGVITTSQGSKLITKALNATLTAFGAKQIPFPAGLDALSNPNFTLPGAGSSPSKSLPGHHALGGKVRTPTYIVGEEAPTHPEYVLATNPSYRRRNLALWASAGRELGVPGFAKGGFTGYSLPLPRGSMMPGSWSFDQGVDIPAGAGTPEFAIGPGVITQEGIGGFGPNAPILRVTAGPLAGESFYYGHAGPNLVRVGQHVRAGQQISEVGSGIVGISTGPHIEFGYWPPRGGAAVAALLNQLMGGAGVTGVGGAAGSGALPTIGSPHVRGSGTIVDIVRGALKKASSGANRYLNAHASALGPAGIAGSVGAAPVGNIMALAQAAAKAAGVPWNAGIERTLLAHESSGGQNLPPSGPLSATGPMQVIPGTFASYHAPGHDNIRSPWDNVLAAFRYIKSRYGTLEHLASVTGLLSGGYHGYAQGGIVGAPDMLGVTGGGGGGGVPDMLGVSSGGGGSGSGPIRGMARLNFLLNKDTPRLADLINYTGQFDDQWVSGYSLDHPTVDTSTGINTPTDGTAPFIDQTFVRTRLGELMQLLGWQTKIRDELQAAAKIVPALIRRIQLEIRKRQRQIEAIKRKIAANLSTIKHLTKTLHGEKDPKRKAALTKTMNGLKDENAQLGGSRTSIGTTGQLGSLTKELTGLRTQLGTVSQDRTDILGPSGIGGSLGDAKLAVGALIQQIQPFGPSALGQALAAAQGSGTSALGDQLSAALSEKNTILSQQLAVSQAQYRVLANFPPFGGTFHGGGIIPGPVGQERMVRALSGERISKIGEDGPNVRVLVEDHRVRVLVDGVEQVVEQVNRRTARKAARRLPGAGGGLQRVGR